jgi:hypothetical protein
VLLSLLLFNIVLEFLARAMRQAEEIKKIHMGKEKVKLSLCADDMILCLNDMKNFTKKLSDIINTFSKVTGIQNHYTKISSFSIYQYKQTEKEYRKTIQFTITSKAKPLLNS